MRYPKTGLLFVCLLAVMTTAAMATDISVSISGPGAVNDSTIKAGEPVTVEIQWVNDVDDLRGFATGFTIRSKDIKKVVHVADSGNGLNDSGDVKGYNGWENSSKWNLRGVMTLEADWDGMLPDTIGFAGLVASRNNYNSHDKMKVLSWEMVVPDAGIVVIDSAFYPPGGKWELAMPDGSPGTPTWGGPYTLKVVK